MYVSARALKIATIVKVQASYASAAVAVFGFPAVSGGYTLIKSLVTQGASRDVYNQELKDFKTLGGFIDDWATRRADWALNGRRDDGSLYSLTRWVNEGKEYAQDAFYRAGMAFNDSFFADAANSAVTLVSNLPKDIAALGNTLTSPTQWPWYAQLGVGVAALFYGSQIYSNFKGRK